MRTEMDALVEGFEYDLWANLQWLAYLKEKGINGIDLKLMAHVLEAQDVWASRVEGNSPTAIPTIEPTEENLRSLNDRWLGLVRDAAEDRTIIYRRTTGEELRLRLSQIARHVVDHGVYHRGELRGLCRGRDASDFPEVGFDRYALQSE